MSIGEPQLGPPKFIREQFNNFFDDWGKYPPSEPIPILKDALDMNLVMFCANPDFVTVEKNNDKNISLYGKLNKNIPENKTPLTESLKDTYARVIEYYESKIVDYLSNNKAIIISAHGNSLRALCKYLFKISDIEINKLEIPTGNPMIINFSENLRIDNAKYLDKERAKPLINID